MRIWTLGLQCASVLAHLELPLRSNRAGGMSKRAVELESNSSALSPLEIELLIGTPPQPVWVTVDTSMSDLILLGGSNDCAGNDTCQIHQYTFDYNLSQTISTNASWNRNLNSFPNIYTDIGAAWISDYIALDPESSHVLENMTMLIIPDPGDQSTFGLPHLGLGPIGGEICVSQVSSDEFYPTYPNFPLLVKQAGFASSSSYSIAINETGGSALFGAYDKSKFHGELSIVPMVVNTLEGEQYLTQKPWSLSVNLYGLHVDSGGMRLLDLNTTEVTVIDSSKLVLSLPAYMLNSIAKSLGAEWLDSLQSFILPCNTTGSFTLEFGSGLLFSLPISDNLYSIFQQNGEPYSYDDGTQACNLNIEISNSTGGIIVGQQFLIRVYTVVDLDRSEIAFASALPNAEDESSVVPIVSSIPNATSADVTYLRNMNHNGSRHIETYTSLSQYTVGSSAAETLGARPSGEAPEGDQKGTKSRGVVRFTLNQSGQLEISMGSRKSLELFWWFMSLIWLFI